MSGNSSRQLCGSEANPSGIYLSFVTQVNPFSNIPVLEDFPPFSGARNIYAFFQVDSITDMTNERKDWLRSNILDIGNASSTVLSHLHLMSANDEVNRHAGNDIIRLQTIVQSIITEVLKLNDTIIHERLSSIAASLNNIWNMTVRLNDETTVVVSKYRDVLEMAYLNDLVDFVSVVHDRMNVALDTLSSNFFEAIPPSSGFGFKFYMDFEIADIIAGGVNVEVSYSENRLFACSRFTDIANYLEGEKSIAFLGAVQTPIELGEFLTVTAGRGFGAAFSVISPKFVYRLHSYYELLEMSVTIHPAEFFRTQKEIFSIFFSPTLISNMKEGIPFLRGTI